MAREQDQYGALQACGVLSDSSGPLFAAVSTAAIGDANRAEKSVTGGSVRSIHEVHSRPQLANAPCHWAQHMVYSRHCLYRKRCHSYTCDAKGHGNA